MIVRISGEGQFDVPESHVDELNRLDGDLTKAVDAGDDGQFTTALEALLASVRTAGEELPADWIGPSDLVDRKSTRLNSSHTATSRMPSSA